MTRGTRTPKRTSAAKRAREPTGLSHETIRTAALALIDDEGLADFSTRKLGRALGCEAMAIYYYYPSKETLFDAVVDKLMAGVGAAADGNARDWVAALRQIAHAYRQIAHDHPKAFPLLATRRFASEGTYLFLDQLFEAARRQGIPDRTSARFYRVVSAYCSGFAMNELAAQRDPKDSTTAALRERFGRVTAVLRWLEPRYLDEVFDFGLEIMLEAIARERKVSQRR